MFFSSQLGHLSSLYLLLSVKGHSLRLDHEASLVVLSLCHGWTWGEPIVSDDGSSPSGGKGRQRQGDLPALHEEGLLSRDSGLLPIGNSYPVS